jgi:hypothetical protein
VHLMPALYEPPAEVGTDEAGSPRDEKTAILSRHVQILPRGGIAGRWDKTFPLPYTARPTPTAGSSPSPGSSPLASLLYAAI